MIKPVPLDQSLKFIGFRISYRTEDVPLGKNELFECDIEKTLIEACRIAMNDGRLRSLIFSWMSVHADRVIAEKLFKLARIKSAQNGHNPMINGLAVFATLQGFHQYKKFIIKNRANQYLIGVDETESFAKIHGYKEDWLKFGMKVPSKLIRIRSEDSLTVAELSKQNLQYRNRLLIGTSWRADVITAIEWGAKTPSEVMHKIGCSYEPAYRVFKEYQTYRSSIEVA